MSFISKVRLLTVFLGLVFLAIIGRLFYWQILSSEKLSAQADRQHFYIQYLPAKRGEIKFTDGSSLVADKNAYLIYANLSKMGDVDKSKVADQLSQILASEVPFVSTSSGQSAPPDLGKFLTDTEKSLKEKITERLSVPDAVWVNLAHFVTRPSQEKIASLNVPGIDFAQEETRDYPEASMAAQLLGFVGSDQNGNPQGYFGLEGFYDRELAGRSGEIRIEKDAFGRPIAIGAEERQDQQDGHDIITTLDPSVQLLVERKLRQGITDWQASGGTAIVMDPKTGAIIAMASFPSYDPNNFSYYPTPWYKNPAIADLYEPGSIMKPVIMAAAINEGKVNPETRCTQCSGPREISGFLVHTFNNEYHSNSTMTDVLVNSDNTGMIFVGERLGFKDVYSYLQKFGFGQKTGVDLQEEEGGGLRAFKDYYPLDQATINFGQGIAVSSLQMVRAMSVIANGGYTVTPHLVAKIVSAGQTIDLPWPQGSRIISDTTSKTVTEMLVQVANLSPEHFPKDSLPELANYRIAAKSGTAQIAVGGQYAKQGTNATLLGFFPADNPKFTIFVKLNEPLVRPWGSDTAGPVFFGIIRDLIHYDNIPPQ